MSSSFLSRFTPSSMSAEFLEEVLVQRGSMISDTVKECLSAFRTGSPINRMFVGARGIGKTHLISVLHHRLSLHPATKDRGVLAWLREEEWGVTSCLDVLMRILRALTSSSVRLKCFDAKYESIYELGLLDAFSAASALLAEIVGDRHLVVFAENFDEIYKSLDSTEIAKLDTFIRQFRLSVICTAQFYPANASMFKMIKLDSLSAANARLLLEKIAIRQREFGLAEFLRTASGRSRVKAVHHLAKGNPRVYVIFSQFLTRHSIEELIEPLSRTIDDLTPYYQSRMMWISPYQQKIIELLCDKRYAITVKEIAQRCFMTQQSASSQLKELRTRQYVQSTQIGRESFYEMQDPLMRLCLEVKKNRGQPLRLLVEFLRSWYSQKELLQKLRSLTEEQELERSCIEKALEYSSTGITSSNPENLTKKSKFPSIEMLVRSLERLDERIEKFPLKVSLYEQKARILIRLGQTDEATLVVKQAILIKPKDSSLQLTLARLHYYENEFENARQLTEEILIAHPSNVDARCLQADCLMRSQRFGDAVLAWKKALQLSPENEHIQFKLKMLQLKDSSKSFLDSLNDAVAELPSNNSLLSVRALVHLRQERVAEAMADVEAVLHKDPDNYFGLVVRCLICFDRKDVDPAPEAFTRLLALTPNGLVSLLCNARLRVERKEYTSVVDLLGNRKKFISKENQVLLAYALMKLERYDEALDVTESLLNRTKKSDFFASEDLFPLDRALELFQWYLEERPSDLKAMLEKADMLANLGNSSEAFESLTNASVLAPDNFALILRVAEFGLEVGEFSQALSFASKALSIEPDNRMALATQSECFYLMRRFTEALEIQTLLMDQLELKKRFATQFINATFLTNESTLGRERFEHLFTELGAEHVNWQLIREELLEDNLFEDLKWCCQFLRNAQADSDVELFLVESVVDLCKDWDHSATEFSRLYTSSVNETLVKLLLKKLLHIIFEADEKTWPERFQLLQRCSLNAAKIDCLYVTFAGFVGEVAVSAASDKARLTRLCDVCRSLTIDDSHSMLALRIADALAQFAHSRDEKILLELPAEERALVRQVFSLDNDDS